MIRIFFIFIIIFFVDLSGEADPKAILKINKMRSEKIEHAQLNNGKEALEKRSSGKAQYLVKLITRMAHRLACDALMIVSAHKGLGDESNKRIPLVSSACELKKRED